MSPGWIEPLLQRVYEDRTRVAVRFFTVSLTHVLFPLVYVQFAAAAVYYTAAAAVAGGGGGRSCHNITKLIRFLTFETVKVPSLGSINTHSLQMNGGMSWPPSKGDLPAPMSIVY